MRRLAYWAPPLVWMVVILGFSTAGFSAERTGGILEPLLRWLWPGATAAQLIWAHGVVRKLAHVVEYAVLGALWFRAFAHAWPRRPGWGASLALVLAAAWAVVDEWHQSSLPSRTGSALDVVLDIAGAGAAVLAMRLAWGLGGDLVTTIMLWVAAVGGVAVIGVNLVAGVHSGSLWLTAPFAAVLLVVRWWRPGRRHARPPPSARAPGRPRAKPDGG